MKWYIEYPIVWIIVFLAYLAWFTSNADPIGLRIILSLVIGTLISAGGYAVYKSAFKKEQKMQKASEEEKEIIKEKERKSNKTALIVLVVIVIFIVILFAYDYLVL